MGPQHAPAGSLRLSVFLPWVGSAQRKLDSQSESEHSSASARVRRVGQVRPLSFVWGRASGSVDGLGFASCLFTPFCQVRYSTWAKLSRLKFQNIFDAVVANREVTILPRSWVRPPAWESKIFWVFAYPYFCMGPHQLYGATE